MDLNQKLRDLLNGYAKVEGTDFQFAVRDVVTELFRICEKDGIDIEARIEGGREVFEEKGFRPD